MIAFADDRTHGFFFFFLTSNFSSFASLIQLPSPVRPYTSGLKLISIIRRSGSKILLVKTARIRNRDHPLSYPTRLGRQRRRIERFQRRTEKRRNALLRFNRGRVPLSQLRIAANQRRDQKAAQLNRGRSRQSLRLRLMRQSQNLRPIAAIRRRLRPLIIKTP